MNADDQKTTMPGPPGGAAARLGTDEAAAPSRSSMAKDERSLPRTPKVARAPALVVTIIVAAIVGLSLWYLVQPQPLMIQGEADATRIDIAARVDGRVGERPVERGDNVAAGQLLYEIDNPELVTKLERSRGRACASRRPSWRISDGRNPRRGDRATESRARQRQCRPHAGAADLRPHQGAGRDRQRAAAATRRGHGSAPGRAAQLDQAKLAYEEAVAGYTKEERGIAARQCRQGAGLDRYDQGAGRRAGGQGADRRAGLPDRRRDRRICLARRAASLAHRS